MLSSLVDALEAGDDRDRASSTRRAGGRHRSSGCGRGRRRRRCRCGLWWPRNDRAGSRDPEARSRVARGHLLAGRDQHVGLAVGREARDVTSEIEQAIGLARPSRTPPPPNGGRRRYARRAWRRRGFARPCRPKCRRTSGRSAPCAFEHAEDRFGPRTAAFDDQRATVADPDGEVQLQRPRDGNRPQLAVPLHRRHADRG